MATLNKGDNYSHNNNNNNNNNNNTDSAVLKTARCLKIEAQRETRTMKDSIAEKTKER